MSKLNKYLLNQLLFNHTFKSFANKILNNSYITQNKIYRYLYKNKIDKSIKSYINRPFSIRIENTNLCNGRCFMCPYPVMKRKKGTMSKILYKKIINQASNLKIDYINLHNFGEPLIDKDFAWRVKYAKSKNISRVSTNTNGTLLTPKLIKDIINSGLDELYISVDAATNKTYQKIRIGLDYKKVLKNIDHLVKIKKQLNSNKPKIILDFLEFNLNEKETKKFINKWKNIVDSICISQIHDWSNKKQININNKISNYVQFSQAPCRLPFTEMLINWDGIVSICCQDIDGEIILGDVNKESIINIWQSKNYQNIRRSHLHLKTNNLKLCKDCKLRTFWWTF